eukprot:GFUD01002615.1.p1 GENE.GFUD01002615.1~~GFUD01002615.1.p1  ORF type:complete len:457 (+),score=94.38 GFUD01002615.1:314-1684(+)
MNTEERKPLLEKKQNYGVLGKDADEERNIITEERDTSEAEGGSAWFIVAASFLCICVLDGTMYSFGAFLEPLMDDLNQPRGTISIAGSLQVALSAFIAPVAGHFVRKKGARVVCLVGAVTASFGLLLASFAPNLVGIFGGLSVLTGIGFGLMYIPAVVAVAENFTTRRSLAVGLSLCGAGAGQIGMAPLVSWVVGGWGWRVGLQVLAGVTLACAGLGLVMKKKICVEAQRIETSTSEEDYEPKRPYLAFVLGRKIASQDQVHVFLVMVLADALAVMALYIPYTYLKPVADAAGIASNLSAILISAIGVGSVSGRLLSGWMSDQPWCHPLFLTRAVISISCALPFLLSWVDHFWMFSGLSIMFGFLTGQWIAATSPLLVSLLGIDQLSQAFGLLTAVRGLASLVSPPLAGLLVDLTTNPLLALYLSGMLLMLSGLVYTLAVWMFRRKTRMKAMYGEI